MFSRRRTCCFPVEPWWRCAVRGNVSWQIGLCRCGQGLGRRRRAAATVGYRRWRKVRLDMTSGHEELLATWWWGEMVSPPLYLIEVGEGGWSLVRQNLLNLQRVKSQSPYERSWWRRSDCYQRIRLFLNNNFFLLWNWKQSQDGYMIWHQVELVHLFRVSSGCWTGVQRLIWASVIMNSWVGSGCDCYPWCLFSK